MEGGLIILAWGVAAVLLVVAMGLVIAGIASQRALKASRQAQAGLEQIIEQANDAIIVLDFVSGRIHHANPSAAKMFGIPVEELLRSSVFDLHFKEDLPRSAERIADVWASGGLVYDDIPFRTASGAKLPVECSAKVAEYQGRPAVVIHARDIAERLQLQREVAEKNAVVEQQNNDMRSGLRYAQGIQMGMLPSLGELRASFANAFVINKPRDIVSGDFHWSARIGDKVLVAVADCTGHGVPGALLSMTGIALLQQVVGSGIHAPDRILWELRAELMRTLAHQEGEGRIRDGMTIGLLVLDTGTGDVEFSGAQCPLYLLRKGASCLEEIKGERIPLGYHDGISRPYGKHRLQLASGDRLYMSSDGFADQFGGADGKKLKSAVMKDLLFSTATSSMGDQGKAMESAFNSWRGEHEQVDDVLLLGLQV